MRCIIIPERGLVAITAIQGAPDWVSDVYYKSDLPKDRHYRTGDIMVTVFSQLTDSINAIHARIARGESFFLPNELADLDRLAKPIVSTYRQRWLKYADNRLAYETFTVEQLTRPYRVLDQEARPLRHVSVKDAFEFALIAYRVLRQKLANYRAEQSIASANKQLVHRPQHAAAPADYVAVVQSMHDVLKRDEEYLLSIGLTQGDLLPLKDARTVIRTLVRQYTRGDRDDDDDDDDPNE
jgi:hypothetical protein